MLYRYVAVDRTPRDLESDAIYVNDEFELATLLCACGCGHKVTLLVPDGHTVINDEGFATVRPSIGVWDAPCRSHYFVSRGVVEWCRSWTEEQIQNTMLRQRARHEADSAPPTVSWRTKLRGFVRKLIDRVLDR